MECRIDWNVTDPLPTTNIGACDYMATAAMGHGLLFDAILLFVKHKRDKGGTLKLMSGGGGGGEAVGSNEEGEISKT